MTYLEYELLVNTDFLTVLRNLVDDARRRVYVATYVASLSDATKPIYYGLAYKWREGLDVAVILNGASQESLKYNTVTADFIRSLGVKNVKFTERFTHIKLYIVDDYFIIGSHNLSASSYLDRYEISLMVHSKRMSDKLAEFFRMLFMEEVAEPAVYRELMENGIYYEVMANYKILQDIYEKTFFASKRIKVMMYIATISRATLRYYALLKRKQEEGLDVAVMLNGASKLSLKYNKEVRDHLKRLGVRRAILTKRFIHTKLFVIDDWAIIGSHNLTAASIAGRLEMSLAIHSPSLANALDHLFEKMFSEELNS